MRTRPSHRLHGGSVLKVGAMRIDRFHMRSRRPRPASLSAAAPTSKELKRTVNSSSGVTGGAKTPAHAIWARTRRAAPLIAGMRHALLPRAITCVNQPCQRLRQRQRVRSVPTARQEKSACFHSERRKNIALVLRRATQDKQRHG